MIGFILRRVVQLAPVLLGVTILAFLLVNLLPGNMALAMLGPDASADAVAHLTEQLGLNQPIWLRYLHWLGSALTGNLGWSIVQAEPVAPTILQRFPVTVEIILLGQAIGVILAVPGAVAAAMRPNGWIDRALGLLAYSAIATPALSARAAADPRFRGLLAALSVHRIPAAERRVDRQPALRRTARRDHRRAGIRGVFPGAAQRDAA